MVFVALLIVINFYEFQLQAKGKGNVEVKKQPSWKYALDFTLEQRKKQHFSFQVVTTDTLVLPIRWTAPSLLKSGGTLPGDWKCWQAIPFKEKHKEYLKIRDKLNKEKKTMELVKWCEKNKLPNCAEFELRGILEKIWSFRKPEYKKYHKKWILCADKRQIDFSFPLPFEGEWFIIKDTSGHHRIKAGAAYAFDCVIKKNKKSFKKTKKSLKLEDFYAFNQPIVAQADGIVLFAEDKYEDNVIGKMGKFTQANMVGVYYGAGISALYGHLKKGSVVVKRGDRVKAGQILGRVGNSGASGMPHLHFTMLDLSVSIKGRFHFKKKVGGKWVEVKGKDLVEGRYVKNITPYKKILEKTKEESEKKPEKKPEKKSK